MAAGIPHLSSTVQKYRVIDGEKIIGQWSNLALAFQALDKHPHAALYDISGKMPRVMYRDGQWRDTRVQ